MIDTSRAETYSTFMPRKTAAALLLGIWIGLFVLEFAYGFSFAGDSRDDELFNDTLVGFCPATELSEDVDGLPPSPLAAARDVFPLSIDESLQLGSREKEGLSRKASEIYKLQHAFLL